MTGSTNGINMPPWLKILVSGVGFLSDAYDLFVMNLVKNVMKSIYTQSDAQSSAIGTAALSGAVLGQLIFGSLADQLGRKTIFVVTLSCVVIGSIGSSLCFDTQLVGIYAQLTFWQFILGFGIGGEYPLSATITSENSDTKNRGKNVSSVFAMQGVGNVLSSLVMFILLASDLKLDYVWRFALAFGALPGLCTVYFRWKMGETKHFKRVARNDAQIVETEQRQRRWQKATMLLSEFKWILLGTAGSWFIFDITFYANGLFSGSIVQAIGIGGGSSNSEKELTAVALTNIIISVIGLPGYIFAVLFVERIGRKRLQLLGFTMVAVVFMIMAAALHPLKESLHWLFIMLYGFTFFFANFGPNTTTFLIPSESFPTRARATCHGLSAASGKLGAVLGGATLKPLLDSYGSEGDQVSTKGLQVVLFVCAAISLVGTVWTLIFTKDMAGTDLEQLERGSPTPSKPSLLEESGHVPLLLAEEDNVDVSDIHQFRA